MKQWALHPYASHQAIEYKIENGNHDYARSLLGYGPVRWSETSLKLVKNTVLTKLLWEKNVVPAEKRSRTSRILSTGNKKERKGHWRGVSCNLWQSLPRCSAGDKANPEKIGRRQCFNDQVTLGRKNKTSTSSAFGRNKWIPSMLNMAKPEGVSNSSNIIPWHGKLLAANKKSSQT